MINVLFFITELHPGGAEKNLYYLAKNLDRHKFNPSVACLFGKGTVAGWLQSSGIPVYCLDMKSKLDMSVISKLTNLLRKESIHLLHTFLFHANIVGRLSAHKARTPCVVSSVRVAERRRPSHLFFDKLTIGMCDKEIAVSNAVRSFMIDKGIPSQKIITIPNAVDVSVFENAREDILHRELSLPRDAFIFTTIGRLDPQKGIDVLITAFKNVAITIPHAVLIVVGKGPMQKKLIAHVAKLSLSDKVAFLGFRDDVPEILRDTDVFVLPSNWEGMPNVLLEAAAARVPLISTNVEGVSEIIRDKSMGEVVPCGDSEALARAMIQLAKDAERRENIAYNLSQHVKDTFSIAKMVVRHAELYDRILCNKHVVTNE